MKSKNILKNLQIFKYLIIITMLFILLFFNMKNFVKIVMLFVACITMFSVSFAQEWKWWSRWSSPIDIFNNVVREANGWTYGIQDTAIDDITNVWQSYNSSYKISNTLDFLRKNIAPYLQWAIYVWFVASTAWLIICGFLLVTWWISKSSGFDKVKWKIVNALLGVFVLSWFYLLIKLMVWIINMSFWGQ